MPSLVCSVMHSGFAGYRREGIEQKGAFFAEFAKVVTQADKIPRELIPFDGLLRER